MKRQTSLATLLLIGALPLAAIAADATQPTQQGSQSVKEETPPMFQQLDTNHDGYVSKEEAKRSADLTARFNQLDTNHDGLISAEEYKKGEQIKQ